MKAAEPKPATPSQRQAALRARRSREGLVRLEVWARVEDHAVIKAYVARLLKKNSAVAIDTHRR